ncbi:MAG: hypothetical protein OXI96_03425 [Acidimicrobiaceae bacterium]|nr:hypothetical protein [Acidimicrobiaceae bacterium]
MTPEVKQGIEGLRACFPDTEVTAVGTGDGGAIVTIACVDPGSAYVQRETWMRFAISFQYPQADIYPLFVRPDLIRVDGQQHGEGITKGEFQGEEALQLSRRSTNLDPNNDTATLKVTKVLEWLRKQ